MVLKGRPKTFDNYDALEKAQKIFWEKGFEGTSMCELVSGMGISRQSLYNTFGNKHDLFISCLEYYIHESSKKFRDLLTSDTISAKEKLNQIIEMVIDNYTCLESKGCFASFAIQEMAQKDPEVKRLLDGKFERSYKQMHEFFEQSLENGKISSQLSAEELTNLFDSILISVTSLCKLSNRDDQIRSLFGIFLKQIQFS
ncbi:MAG: TetR/AcrR family transcriptional regulator [Bdellovibrionota bacterium]|nr:TetR/AcrR family transcriptional regulator [Bdellovibrionota bacterium]